MQMSDAYEMSVTWLQCGNNLTSMFLNTSKFTRGRRAVKKATSMQSWYHFNWHFFAILLPHAGSGAVSK